MQGPTTATRKHSLHRTCPANRRGPQVGYFTNATTVGLLQLPWVVQISTLRSVCASLCSLTLCPLLLAVHPSVPLPPSLPLTGKQQSKLHATTTTNSRMGDARHTKRVSGW